jgi:hypothetical protein
MRASTRGRRVVFAPTSEVVAADVDPVPRIGPIVFTVHVDGRDHLLDWSALPCPRLTRCLAEVLRRSVQDDGTRGSWHGVLNAARHLRGFVQFIAAVEVPAADQFGLADLEPEHLDAFEQALLVQHGPDSTQPYAAMAHVTQALRAAAAVEPERVTAELAARIRFNAREVTLVRKEPLDAYPPGVFEAVKNAATQDVRKILQRIQEGEAWAARGDDPDVAGWSRTENILWHIIHHGPVASGHHETTAIRRAGGIRWHNRWLHLRPLDLVPLLVLLISLTGMEPECAKTLRADCLINPARGFVGIRYLKRRARGHEAKTLRVSDGGALHHPGGLLRVVLRLTQHSRTATGSPALWLDHSGSGTHESFDPHNAGRALWPVTQQWMRQHQLNELIDYDGQPASLDLRRLRKSYKSQQYLKAAGVLADFTTGHSTDVAARHYADIGAHRELHEQAVEDGLVEARDVASPPVVVDDDGTRLDAGPLDLPAHEVQAALSGATDVFLASCRDFHDSPFAAKGKPCPSALWGCLECPNAVFSTRHLPQVLLFLDFIERQREDLSVAEWNSRYAIAWQRIVEGIRNKFACSQIETARAVAQGAGTSLLIPPAFWVGVA